jgi:hypothetical protein
MAEKSSPSGKLIVPGVDSRQPVNATSVRMASIRAATSGTITCRPSGLFSSMIWDSARSFGPNRLSLSLSLQLHS